MVCFCSIFNVVVEHHLHSFAQAHTLPHATHEHDTLLNSKENSFSSFFGTKCARVCPPLAVHPFIRKLKIFSHGIWLMADWLRYFLAARTQFSSFSTRLEVMYENSVSTVVKVVRVRHSYLLVFGYFCWPCQLAATFT